MPLPSPYQVRVGPCKQGKVKVKVKVKVEVEVEVEVEVKVEAEAEGFRVSGVGYWVIGYWSLGLSCDLMRILTN